MQLDKQLWTKQDREEFDLFLQSHAQAQKVDWTRRILNTSMPLLAIPTPVFQNLVKQICKGNIVSFLEHERFLWYENTVIYGALLTKLPFEQMQEYLQKLAKVCDNWATCDTIPFKNIQKTDKEKLFVLGKQYAKKNLPFERRIGMKIMMEFAGDQTKTAQIFELLNEFEQEEHYYVNMMNAWLLCELFIKQKEQTWAFLRSNKLNKFTINKAISKCRDSFRVTPDEKQTLLNFKK